MTSPDCVISITEESYRLAKVSLTRLEDLSWTLASCESITGGAIGALVTSIAGASKNYRGGLITYASDLKTKLAGVDAQLIRERGVINEETAKQMAIGVRNTCLADIGLSITGVAGPQPQDGAEIGTVWIGVAKPYAGQIQVDTKKLQLSGDRCAIRKAAVENALRFLLERLV